MHGAGPVAVGTVGYQEGEPTFASTMRIPGQMPFQTRSRHAKKPDTHTVDYWHVRPREKAPSVKEVVLGGGLSNRLSLPTAINNHLLPIYNNKPMIPCPLRVLIGFGDANVLIVAARPDDHGEKVES